MPFLDVARGRYALAALVYALMTAALLHNLLPVMSTRIYSDIGDPLLNASILAWNAKHLPLTDAWWNYPSFAPLSGVTAWTEHLLGAYPLTTPIVWATGNPVLAYNVLLVSCFPLNGVAMFALAREITRSDAAAFVAGLAFAFAPYRSAEMSHVQMLMAFGMPVALLGLHQYVEHGRRGGIAWFGAGWASVILSSAYMLVFFPILVALWCVWFVRRGTIPRLVPIAVTAMLVMAAVAPLLWGFHVRQAAYGFHRDLFDVQSFSADVAGVAAISHRASLWRGILRNDLGESAIFPGLAILALSVVAVASHLRPGAARGRGSRHLAAAALCCFGVALTPMAAGAVRPFRVFTVGVIFLLMAIVLSRRFRDAWRRRDAVVLYATAAIVMWLLALGPEPSWSGSRVLTYGPFWLLMHLPGGDSIRVAARAWSPAVLGLAITAGAGAAILMRHIRWRWVTIVLVVMIVGEGSFADAVSDVPVPIWREAIPRNALVMDLPVDELSDNAAAQYFAVLDGYRTVNGYSGYEAPHYHALRDALVAHRRPAFDAFRRLDDLYVIARPVVGEPLVRWLASQDGAELLFDMPDWKLYRLPRLGAAVVAVPLPLPSRGATAFEIR